MVSNLVSNAGCQPLRVPCHPLWLPYICLTLDWSFSIVNWLYQAVSVGLDGFICAVGRRLYVSLRRLLNRCMIPLLNVDLPRILLSVLKRTVHGPYGG